MFRVINYRYKQEGSGEIDFNCGNFNFFFLLQGSEFFMMIGELRSDFDDVDFQSSVFRQDDQYFLGNQNFIIEGFK